MRPSRSLLSPTAATLFAMTCLFVVAALSAASPPTHSPGADWHDAAPVMLPLTSPAAGGAAEPILRVAEEFSDGLRLEFELPALATQAIEIGGETFQLLAIEGGGVSGAAGQPMLPTFSRLIEIPAEAGITYTVTARETIALQGYRPLPLQPEDGGEFVIDRAAYERAGFLGEEPARIGQPAIARGRRVVPITFAPVRYDPSRDLLEVATRIEVEIRYAGVDLRNALTHQPRRIPPSFDRLYHSLIVNYEGPREGQDIAAGSYVLICRDDPNVVALLQPLVEWRTRKGFEVHLATTTETGNTSSSIQAWLRDAYNNWENPPEFITLVGDATGSYSVAAGGSNSDFEYSQLDGGDYLADAHVGRISIETLNQLELYVEKIVGYERTPYMEQTNWYTEACLTGDPGSSGITCVQIMQWHKIRLLEYGYTEVDTIFSSPFVSQMMSSMNSGVGIFSYRGYLGMSGFDGGDVNALNNGRKLIYAINITCGTGSWTSGTAISESWIRAGSPGSPKGGIASIGAATSGTHTRYNNCFTYGIWRGAYWENLWTFGESFTRGTYELYVNYNQGDPGAVSTWCRYINLMGDAAGELWTGVPAAISVTHPGSVPLGANSVHVQVRAGLSPVPDARVCLWNGDDTHIVGYTDADGAVDVPISAWFPGEMKITVTKHDHHPYLATIPVAQEDLFVGYLGHTLDDDDADESSGNGDGLANPGETLEIPVNARNFGTQTAYDVTGTLTCEDPYVTILDDSELFGDIDAGWTAWSSDDFDLTVSGGAPNRHLIRLALDLESGADSWRSLIDLPVVAAELYFDDVTLYDMGTQIDPGDTGEISVAITNLGDADASDVTADLLSNSSWVTVTDASGSYPDIGVGATRENTDDRFGIAADEECFDGHLADMVLVLDFSGGARDTVHFVLQVGSAASTDPTGPDRYGYYAFDNTDTGYEHAPVYDWVEIASNHGGPGIDVGLNDSGGSNDDSRVVDLPFPFTFYGESFTRATICSNGWLSMGATYLENRRNWNIPAAGAPPYLIAPMWDNLYQSGDDQVYHWYDEANHRYIVQWSRLRNNQGGSTENFEAILYDPAYYETPTGDGEIVFQYETFNNSDYLQHYCTVGIENEDQTDGVCYSYFNRYTAGSPTISSGRAIKFTAIPNQPRGTLSGLVRNATDGDAPIADATVRILELEDQITTNADGSYQIAIPVGSYTLVADHVSFAPDTAFSVLIVQSETTEVDFSLIDDLPPRVTHTTNLTNTGDDVGPYTVYTSVSDYSTLESITLVYRIRAGNWIELPMTPLGDEHYRADIQGQPYGTLIEYYARATDVGELVGLDPPGAPETTYEFWVLEPLLSSDLESGVSDWEHYVATGGFVDQWHLSTQRNHTPLGSWSWKLGAEGPGNYAEYGDGALELPPIELDGDPVTLTFWQWIAAEAEESQPGYAYDGGLLEVSVDGGDWTQIFPFGSYPYRILHGGDPGPFPAETPVFSGRRNWTQISIQLAELDGSVRIRFRFGSDGSNGLEGWYIDDLQILPNGPGSSDATDFAAVPRILALRASTPNPFRAAGRPVRISFDLPRASEARLAIFDVAGRQIRQLVNGTLPAGVHDAHWDGRAANGRSATGGIYFYILEADQQRIARRLLLMR